jgi:hypothetical protein
MPLAPLLYAKFDETTGTSAVNSGSVAVTGTENNCTQLPGILNNALQFNGSSSYVSFPHVDASFDFERTNPFSISAWIKTSNTGLQGIISKVKSGGATQGWKLTTQGNVVYFKLTYTDGTGIEATNTLTVTDNNWHHVVATYDGSNSSAGMKFYIDNSLDSSSSLLNNLTANIVTGSLSINVGRTLTSQYFNGMIDELQIFNSELSQSDVNTLYHEVIGSGPILCWNYRAKYKNSNRIFTANGGGKFPAELKIPSSVDASTGIMVDEGILIPSDKFKIIQ